MQQNIDGGETWVLARETERTRAWVIGNADGVGESVSMSGRLELVQRGGKRVQNVGVQKRGQKTKASCRRKIGAFFERENGWAKNGTPKIERKMD